MTLGFPFQLHHNVIRNDKNRRDLEEILFSVYDSKLFVTGELVDELRAENKRPDEETIAEDIKEVFGEEL